MKFIRKDIVVDYILHKSKFLSPEVRGLLIKQIETVYCDKQFLSLNKYIFGLTDNSHIYVFLKANPNATIRIINEEFYKLFKENALFLDTIKCLAMIERNIFEEDNDRNSVIIPEEDLEDTDTLETCNSFSVSTPLIAPSLCSSSNIFCPFFSNNDINTETLYTNDDKTIKEISFCNRDINIDMYKTSNGCPFLNSIGIDTHSILQKDNTKAKCIKDKMLDIVDIESPHGVFNHIVKARIKNLNSPFIYKDNDNICVNYVERSLSKFKKEATKTQRFSVSDIEKQFAGNVLELNYPAPAQAVFLPSMKEILVEVKPTCTIISYTGDADIAVFFDKQTFNSFVFDMFCLSLYDIRPKEYVYIYYDDNKKAYKKIFISEEYIDYYIYILTRNLYWTVENKLDNIIEIPNISRSL